MLGAPEGPSNGKLQALYKAEQALMALFPFMGDGGARRLSDLKAELREMVLGADEEGDDMEEEGDAGKPTYSGSSGPSPLGFGPDL